MDIITQSLARRANPTKQDSHVSKDIVGLFLDRFDGTNGEKLDVTYLRDIVVNFLVAGRDSTAQTMSWLIYNLSFHPEVLTKIRNEVRNVLPTLASEKSTTLPTMEEVQEFVYLEATLKETLRLYPTVPLVPKAMAKDVVFSDGTLMRAGTLLTISTYAMGRMEFVWGPDAKVFNPDRWIDPATGKLLTVSTFKFASFNAGPRMCLGMNLAMLEMKIILASVLCRFDFEVLPGQNITYANSLTLPINGQLLAHVRTVETAM